MSKVLILGAGSSYGHGAKNVKRPPIANGFFTHSLFSTLSKDYKPLIHYLEETIRSNVNDAANVNIERLFAQVEPLWRLHIFDNNSDEIKNRFDKEFELVTPLDMLRSFVTDLIYLSTSWLSKIDCPYHNKLASDWITKGDTIISFNYDLIMDTSLLRNTSWRESTGYGWNSKGKPSYFEEEYSWKDESEYIVPDISLLKLHGSLNFSRCNRVKSNSMLPRGLKFLSKDKEKKVEYENYDSVAVTPIKIFWNEFKPKFLPSFVRDYYQKHDDLQRKVIKGFVDAWSGKDCCEIGLLPLLIMPTPYKPFHEMTFGEFPKVWNQAYKSIENAEEAISCGFSFADQYFNNILLEATRKRRTKLPLTIIDPSEYAYTDISKRISNYKVDMKPFNGGLGEFVSLL